MVKRRKSKKIKRRSQNSETYNHTKTDNFFKKYGIIILIFFGVIGFILDPQLWYDMGNVLWAAVPVVGILLFYSVLSGDKKNPINPVGKFFILFIIFFIIGSLILGF